MSNPFDNTLAPGTMFQGRYRVVRPVKAGAMGAVYEVIDARTNGARALKVMLPSLVANAEQRQRFEQEARVTGAIESEHVVRVFDAGIDAGVPFLVMELLRGEELQGMLDRRGPLPPEEACRLLMQVARALDKTYAAGIVHRDIKPENLFVAQREDGSPCMKILDFGLARVEVPTKAKNTRVLGTPLYMAPEQIRGEGKIDARADFYALAHVAYAMLVGEPYWSGEVDASASVMVLMLSIMNGAKEPATARAARRRGASLPASFDPWFGRATFIDPNQRFPSAVAQIEALRSLWPAGDVARVVVQSGAHSRLDSSPDPHGDSFVSRETHFANSPDAEALATRPTAAAPAPGAWGREWQVTHHPGASHPAPTQGGAGRKRSSGLVFAVAGVVAAALVIVGALAAVRWTRRHDREPRARQRSTAPDKTAAVATAKPLPPGCATAKCVPLPPIDETRVPIGWFIVESEKAVRTVDPQAKIGIVLASGDITRDGVDARVEKMGNLTGVYVSPTDSITAYFHGGYLAMIRQGVNLSAAVLGPVQCPFEKAWDARAAAGITSAVTHVRLSSFGDRKMTWHFMGGPTQATELDATTCALVR